MAKSDIGLKLLSLYRDITKACHNNDSGRASNDLIKEPDTSTVEEMTAAITVVLPNKDNEEPRGQIIRAIKCHTDKYGYLNSEAKYLLDCICNEFGIHESII